MVSRPTKQLTPGHLFCFGLGFTAVRLSKRLLATGWKVSGTNRTLEKTKNFQDMGIISHLFDGSAPIKNMQELLSDVTHLVSSIPPSSAGDVALSWHGKELREAPELKWVSYLSTPAVYGDRGGGLVSESDGLKPTTLRGKRRLAAECAWTENFSKTAVSLQIMRLAGIYGPGRNMIDQVANGRARIIEKSGQVFNRIHVDDIGTVLIASMLRPNDGRVYNVADNEACASGEVVRYACKLLEVESPNPIPFEDARLSEMAKSFYSECKVLDTSRLKEELLVELAYPTFREGLRHIFETRSWH